MISVRMWLAAALFATVVGGTLWIGGYTPTGTLFIELSSSFLAVWLSLLVWFQGDPGAARSSVAAAALAAYAIFNSLRLWFGATRQWYLTFSALLLVCSYLFLFLVGSSVGGDDRASRFFRRALSFYGPLLAAYALIQIALTNGKIFWIYTPPQAPELAFGPYVNRDHFAAAIELLFPFVASTAVAQRLQTKIRVFAITGCATMLASVIASRSRAGSLLMFVEVMTMLWVSQLARSAKWKLSAVTVACVALLISADAWHASDSLINRFLYMQNTTGNSYSRVTIARDSLAMLRAAPWIGTGLGTFRHEFPRFKTLPGAPLVTHAHNDYLEVLCESGILGSLPWFAFLFWVLRECWRCVSDMRRGCVPYAVAIACFLLHSFVDFNLFVPGNAALFYALCGMLIAAEKSRDSTTFFTSRVHPYAEQRT